MAEDPICLTCCQPIVPGAAVVFRAERMVHLACLPGSTTRASADALTGGRQTAEAIHTLPRGVRPRVLLIDDEPQVRAVVGDVLDSLGYQVDEAEDGVQALAALDQHRYDLLVTDLRMPQMSGWEVVEAVSRRWPMPIVIMSGFITPADERRAQDAGLALLRKPFGFAELKRAIQEGLARHGADVPRKPLAKSGEGTEPEAGAQQAPPS